MNYILKQFDEPLVKFSATTDTSEPEIQILWTNEEKAAFLPLDLTLTPDGLSRWLRRRTIPKNRAYVHSLLAKCGLNLNRPLSIISICKGLSLNDCYWVIEDGDTASFDKVNLFDNPFSNVLAELAFTGYGSRVRASLLSSPEFTTNGMLRKCWRRIGQGMNGQAVRGQHHDLFDGALYIRLQFSRQSQDQIHIDIVEADFSCQIICRK